MGNGLSVVIPAAGAGRRMRSFGPKALLRLKPGETILSRQLRLIHEHLPGSEVVVVVGHNAEKVARAAPDGVRLVVGPDHLSNNVACSIATGLKVASQDRVLVVYGDLVFSPEALLPFTRPLSCSTVLVSGADQMSAEEVGVTVWDGQARHFAYGLDTRWGQMVYLTPRDRQLLGQLASAPSRQRYYGFELLNLLIEQGCALQAVQPEHLRISDVDCSRDLERAREIAR